MLLKRPIHSPPGFLILVMDSLILRSAHKSCFEGLEIKVRGNGLQMRGNWVVNAVLGVSFTESLQEQLYVLRWDR
jgi:hypothetical protein